MGTRTKMAALWAVAVVGLALVAAVVRIFWLAGADPEMAVFVAALLVVIVGFVAVMVAAWGAFDSTARFCGKAGLPARKKYQKRS